MSTFQLIEAQSSAHPAIPIELIDAKQFPDWIEVQSQSSRVQKWVQTHQYDAGTGVCLVVPSAKGSIERVFFGLQMDDSPWEFSKILRQLPPGSYHFSSSSLQQNYPWQDLLLVWGLANYSYDRYKAGPAADVFLVIPDHEQVSASALLSALQASYLVRDLVNTPAEDCSPDNLLQQTKMLCEKHQGQFMSCIGEELCNQGFPLVHAVGRASSRDPLVCGFTSGNPKHPRVVLIGKGVCFDSGGLQVKPHLAMSTMKKDMGGAAHMLGLASMILDAKLPIYLEIYIAAVDNSIAGNAFRPGDVFAARNGTRVEIGHTDAEGRLLLADLLAFATEKPADIVIDYATLTGAQRVALGPDMPAVFCDDDESVESLLQASALQHDPIWRLPLHKEYKSTLDSDIADISSTGSMSLGGAITAALFLQHFVDAPCTWMHLDGGAYNLTAKPGRPKGGEAMGMRALFASLKARYGR